MSVFGITFAQGNTAELAVKLADMRVEKGQGVRNLITPNLEHIVQVTRDPRLRRAYDHAWLAIADGVPVYLYARLRGEPIAERIAGSTLFDRLLPLMTPSRHRCFFVCPSSEVANFYEQLMHRRGFSHDTFAVFVPPLGFERDPILSDQLADKISSFSPTHLFFGVSSVKSEIWVDEYRERLCDCYAFCVGAALNFTAGQMSRAPVVVQKLGMEWAWRFAQEPRRLFRRYFIDSWTFLSAVRDDLRHSVKR